MSERSVAWREKIVANLHLADPKQIRSLFEEINPHLVGDPDFEIRWTKDRRDAAVLVGIVDRPDPAVLLTVRSSQMPTHAGQISFPGGKTAPGDKDATATALREAHEEVNIIQGDVEVIGSLGIHEGGAGFSVTPVIGVVDPQADLRPCPREVDEIFEVPLAFIADPASHIIETRSHNGVDYKMFATPYGEYHIWGLTAGILRTLCDIMNAPDSDERIHATDRKFSEG